MSSVLEVLLLFSEAGRGLYISVLVGLDVWLFMGIEGCADLL